MDIVDRKHHFGVALLRIDVGIIFLTARLEKILGTDGWSAAGFLQYGTAGTMGWPWVPGGPVEGTAYNPTQDFWVGLAANDSALSFINFLVPYGQVAIGISLILGLLTRFGAAMGTLMMLIFFVAAWDFEFGIVNQHLTYAVVTAFIGYIGAGHFYGLDPWLEQRVRPAVARWLCSGGTAEQRTQLGLVGSPLAA